MVLKKFTVTTATTSTIRQPLKVVTGGALQSPKAIISVSEQAQQLGRVQEDLPVTNDSVAIDPHRVKAEILQTKSLPIVSSREELEPVDKADDEESKRASGIYTAGGIIIEQPFFRALDHRERIEVVPGLQVLANHPPG